MPKKNKRAAVVSETAAIVGIYGAIDRAVNAEPLARTRVAQFLSPYRVEPELSWYDDFLEWLEDGGRPELPDLDGALEKLAGAEPPDRRARARRLFALAVAARAIPAMTEHGTLRDLAINTLKAFPAVGAEPAEPARLYAALSGEGPVRTDAMPAPGTDKWWGAMVKAASDTHVIGDDHVGMYPKPCTGLVMSVPGYNRPCAALKTVYRTTPEDGISFEDATRFLEPANWQTCRGDFWCEMKDLQRGLPNGQHVYHERVATYCKELDRGFSAETDLLFNFMWVPDDGKPQAAVANYELADGRPHQGDRIELDEGTLVVSKVSEDELEITTTKRVIFSHPFSAGALAMIVCALGYADMSTDLMVCAAKDGSPFVGLPYDERKAYGAKRSTDEGEWVAVGAPVSSREAPPGGLFQEAMDIWARALSDGARALERNFAGAGQTGTKGRRRG